MASIWRSPPERLLAPLVGALGEQREKGGHCRQSFRPGLGPQEQPHAQVLLDAQGAEYIRQLGHVADPQRHQLVGGAAGDLAAIEVDGTGADRDQPEKRLYQGRLAGSVGPDHPDELSDIDDEVHPTQDVDSGEIPGDHAGGGEQGTRGHSGISPCCEPR
jgi:hypothetical protein